MFDRFAFYIRHSLNDLRVNGQRTFFALLCIAAGVAAIVSLQTLAVMIETTLTGSLQENNRGDIQFQAGNQFIAGTNGSRSGRDTETEATEAQTPAPATSQTPATSDESPEDLLQRGIEDGVLVENTQSFFGQTATSYDLSPAGLQVIQAWADDNYPGEVELTYDAQLTSPISALFGGTGASIAVPETGAQADSLSAVVVEADKYPFYSQIVSQDGQTLAEMIRESTDIVINEDVAEMLEAEIGTVVRISGSDADFTVRGIVKTEQQIKGFSDAMLTILSQGFYYLDVDALQLFADVSDTVSRAYIRLENPERVTEINAALNQRFPYLNSDTTEGLREQNAEIARNVNQLVTVMGLISLLIGSIGIINTMQVIVRRRTLEVAVLKTIGLQADQVTMLFLVEAILMGIIGSLAGIVLGWLAVFVVRGAAEQLFARPLPFVFAPGAALNGFIVGVLVTAVFGFLPTLSAGQVRPGVVLRPSDNVIPRAGLLRSLFAILVIILALTLIAQTIIGSFRTSLIVIVSAFLLAGLLYLWLSFLIWLFGRFFPSFGVADLKISLRQMNAGRRRAAVTLLALVIGVFSLSLITLLAESVNGLLRFGLEEASGGNIAIMASNAAQVPQIEEVLTSAEGVNSYTKSQSYNMSLISMQESTGETVSLDEIGQRLVENVEFPFGPPPDEEVEIDQLEIFLATFSSVGARDVTEPERLEPSSGRVLTAEDAGKPVMVLTDNQWVTAAGISVGDKLTFAFGGDLSAEEAARAEQITFEVVGILPQSIVSGGFNSSQYAPADAFPSERQPDGNIVIADVQDEAVPELRRQLATVRGAFVLETAVFTRLIETLLGTFTAFPTMVAALGLVVGGVVIANSVALTTMERRREIAIMKAVGLQRERVLLMILLENGILGFIGGLLGVGIGLVGLVISVASFSMPGSALPWGTALVLMLLCIAVALIAAMTTAWGASGEKPLNVLRYE